MYAKQQLRTKHDTNGNPRRVWVLYRISGNHFPEVVAVKDEGYGGDPFREVYADLPSIAYGDYLNIAAHPTGPRDEILVSVGAGNLYTTIVLDAAAARTLGAHLLHLADDVITAAV